MIDYESMFVFIARFSALAFVLLGCGVVALRFFQQPMERIRLIQISFAVIFFATLFSVGKWQPSIDLPWLPNSINLPQQPIQNSTVSEIGANNLVTDFEPAEGSALTKPPARVATSLQRQQGSRKGKLADSPNIASANPPINAIESSGVVRNPTTGSVSSTVYPIFSRIVVVGFFLGFVLQVIYVVIGFVRARFLLKSAQPFNKVCSGKLAEELFLFSNDKRVAVEISDQIDVPIAAGIFRPKIVLPRKMVGGQSIDLQLHHALEHEWKHIEQKDLLTWQLVSLCQVVFWYQPFFWILRREIRVSQDFIADEYATEQKRNRTEYAAVLVQFAKRKNLTMTGALTMAGTKSNLFRRIDMLLNRHFRIAAFSRKSVVFSFTGMMVISALMLISIQLTHAAAPAENTDLASEAAASNMGNEPANKRDTSNGPQDKRKSDAKKKATKPVTHTGVIIDSTTSKPIANATVIVTRMNSKTWKELGKTESKTNALGEYSFNIPVDQMNERYLYLLFDLRHETYAPRHCGSYSYSMIKKNLKLGDPPWFTKLKMLPGEKIEGRLVDKSGEPIANVEIRVNSTGPGSQRDFSNRSSSKTTSAADGTFEAILTKEGTANISMIPRAHCMSAIDLGTKRGNLGDIELADGFSVIGKVLDARGKPMKDLWVNLSESGLSGHYEMKRSSKTNADGEFETRVVKSGKYLFQIETKATGAIEKVEYANFSDEPPPAVFVRQVIEITEDTASKPIVIQAVPHIYIKGQCYDSKGKKIRFHFPMLGGIFDGQLFSVRSKKGAGVGAFTMMIPHGVERARLSFLTNEHSALTVKFAEDKKPTIKKQFEFDKIEEDMTDIEVVRYVAPILQVKVVDETGKLIENAQVGLVYKDEGAPNPRLVGVKTHVFFEKQGDKVFRSSSLVPGIKFEVFAKKEGFESERKTLSMKEGGHQIIQIKLKPVTKIASGKKVSQ